MRRRLSVVLLTGLLLAGALPASANASLDEQQVLADQATSPPTSEPTSQPTKELPSPPGDAPAAGAGSSTVLFVATVVGLLLIAGVGLLLGRRRGGR